MVADRIPGGIADNIPDDAFDPQALAQGIRVESEHTSDKDVAREIATDHLAEDPEYYQKLKLVEDLPPVAWDQLLASTEARRSEPSTDYGAKFRRLAMRRGETPEELTAKIQPSLGLSKAASATINPLIQMTPDTAPQRGDENRPPLLWNPTGDPDFENGYSYAQELGHLPLGRATRGDVERWQGNSPAWRAGFAAASRSFGLARVGDAVNASKTSAALALMSFVYTIPPISKVSTMSDPIVHDDLLLDHEIAAIKQGSAIMNAIVPLSGAALGAGTGYLAGGLADNLPGMGTSGSEIQSAAPGTPDAQAAQLAEHLNQQTENTGRVLGATVGGLTGAGLGSIANQSVGLEGRVRRHLGA